MSSTSSRMLEVAAQQFAEKGYSGTSMRSIATATGTTQAAIYHHFPNKEALYLSVLSLQLKEKTGAALEGLDQIKDPEQCLRELIFRLVRLAEEDEQFRQLYFRELLEGNEERLATLAENVFGGLLDSVGGLLNKLAPRFDLNLLLLSVAGLVCHHVEARKISPFMPGSEPDHQELDTLSEHITKLLLYGVRGA
ncbi:TetR/AcrR family transcriptional regulator [Halioglobus maricola]|uniref:TetR/AcrR family transcriptional regulator n=1 Tax=Halioglobus maricola TaxID=2601894 RepID=A0A5P9NMY3_9GAMM|nr:TetR/AcrR family transcriptional regulator [Halioglobus maricola]QFU77180.1 TetR/AcrR family transcriptional regulator [Halioglobus maricola]